LAKIILPTKFQSNFRRRNYKRKALEKYATQLRSSFTLKSFIRRNEIFFQVKDTNSYYTDPDWSKISNSNITDIETPANLPTNYALGYLGKGFHIKNFSIEMIKMTSIYCLESVLQVN